jgi:hypothetical protein
MLSTKQGDRKMGYGARLNRTGRVGVDPVSGCKVTIIRESSVRKVIIPEGRRFRDINSTLPEMTKEQVINYLSALEVDIPITDEIGWYWSNTGVKLTDKQVKYQMGYEDEHYGESPFPPDDPNGQALIIINEYDGKVCWYSFNEWFADNIIEISE